MQFGLFMTPLHPPERPFAEAYDRDQAQIVLADQRGYHEAWIGEHLTERWANAPAPDLLIAPALLQTEKSILATGDTLLALHHPMEVAHRYQHPKRRGTLQTAAGKSDPHMPDEAMDVDYMMEPRWIVGDPQACADRMRQLSEQVGGFGKLLASTQDSDDPSWDHRSLQLPMEEVGPRLSDLL
ncbi:MAG: LLM class flavin-dependent oxidoreductase [Candidatus Tectimicrobiota bacterium]